MYMVHILWQSIAIQTVLTISAREVPQSPGKSGLLAGFHSLAFSFSTYPGNPLFRYLRRLANITQTTSCISNHLVSSVNYRSYISSDRFNHPSQSQLSFIQLPRPRRPLSPSLFQHREIDTRTYTRIIVGSSSLMMDLQAPRIVKRANNLHGQRDACHLDPRCFHSYIGPVILSVRLLLIRSSFSRTWNNF